jgi:serine protease Do
MKLPPSKDFVATRPNRVYLRRKAVMSRFRLGQATVLTVVIAGFSSWQVSAANERSTNLEVARQLDQAFVEVAAKVSPAVVVINVVQRVKDDEEDGTYESLPPGFWRYFHRQFQNPQPEKALGEGSGVIIRDDGYILTNGHVVQDAESIEVRLQDGRTFKAKLRGVDPQSDVAVIKIEAKGLPVATFGDSTKARVGEFAIAIGAPFTFDYSVTFGHVSAKGRSNVVPGYEGAAMDQDFIQTDANINPGNSGGPLVNINGEVIGINTLIRGLHTGIGFAIPSNFAKEVADKLIANGKFTRAWLGVEIHGIKEDSEFRELVKGVEDGVVVRSILPNGPASKSDLRPSDIITAVDGKPVATAQDLRSEIREKAIGQPVTLDIYRPSSAGNGKTLKVKVSPGEWIQPETTLASVKSAPATASKTNFELGVTVRSLTSEVASQFGVEMTDGVVVVSVEKNSPAALKDIKPGDVITAINQAPVTNPKEFRDALKQSDPKKGILVNLVSGNSSRFEIVKQTGP